MQDSRAESYMESHDLKNFLNDLEGGLQRYQPNDPLGFIIGCVRSVQQVKRESKEPLSYSKLFEEYAAQKFSTIGVMNAHFNGFASSNYPTGPNNKKRHRSEDASMEIRTPPHYTSGSNFDQHVPHQHFDEDQAQRRPILPPSPPNSNLSVRFVRNHIASVGRRRRNSVSAESISPSGDPNDRKIIPKSEDTIKLIEDAILQNLLFKNLDRETKRQVVDAMSEVIVRKNETIITQGEVGDNFYVIEHGLFGIFIDNQFVLEIGHGNSFGELALMYNTNRAATVKAKTDGILWALDRVSFHKTITNLMYKKRKTYEAILKSVALFSSLDSSEITKLADALEPCEYEDGKSIVTQGETESCFYVIEKGRASVSKINEHGIKQYLPDISEGGYFGEHALFEDQPYRETVVARGHVRVAALKRATFVELLGPIMDILNRNAQAYNMNAENNNNYSSNYDSSYSPVPEPERPSGPLTDINVPNHNGGNESMAIDEDYSTTTSARPSRTIKRSGYSGAGGVDLMCYQRLIYLWGGVRKCKDRGRETLGIEESITRVDDLRQDFICTEEVTGPPQINGGGGGRIRPIVTWTALCGVRRSNFQANCLSAQVFRDPGNHPLLSLQKHFS
ncbi:5581_t:CDS:10 [Acaulospora morrowiae]|uniref:cGMP-dependent protein kinase n=1 Tax=Acaulospora morrowiae TaxID=94023 RepID=A0A9N8VPF2_9GLOM|nr:5581_t:CDS:10 [Acaulospora morrowiae]